MNNEIFNLKEINKFIKQNYSIQKIHKYLKFIILIIVFFVLILNKNKKIYEKTNHIHIALSLNNNYTYPVMVSITSILLNSNKNTFIHFHILVGKDVKIENKKKISSLRRLNHNSSFSFHNVGNTFNGWIHGKKKLTVASFYRSFAAELIKNVDKIIYLDGDTLTYGDLSEMYQLKMYNYYFRGVREILPKGVEAEIDKSRFICAGVMLMNLKLIRKNHMFNAFKKYYLNFF